MSDEQSQKSNVVHEQTIKNRKCFFCGGNLQVNETNLECTHCHQKYAMTPEAIKEYLAKRFK